MPSMSVLIDRILALDGETVCLGIGGKAAPAGVLMVAEYCEQYFYAQRVQIGYVPRIEGALYLWIEMQYRQGSDGRNSRASTDQGDHRGPYAGIPLRDKKKCHGSTVVFCRDREDIPVRGDCADRRHRMRPWSTATGW